MRALHVSAILLALSLLIPVGCSGDKAPAEAPEAAEKKAEAPTVVPEAVAKPQAPKAEAKAESKAEAPKAEASKAEASKVEAAPTGAGGAGCAAACANLTKLMLSTLPPQTPPAVRESVMKELAGCPADCAKESNPGETKCLISATSMADLQKCTGLK
jgi:hypothetical protein